MKHLLYLLLLTLPIVATAQTIPNGDLAHDWGQGQLKYRSLAPSSRLS